MSLARGFGELFLSAPIISLSIYTRVTLPMAMLILSVFSSIFRDRGLVFVLYGYCVIVFALCISKTLKKSLKGLSLPFVFLALGFITYLVTMALGYQTPSIYVLAFSSLKVALIFLSITLFFKWVNFREVRYILSKIGLSGITSYLSIAFTIMPTLFNLYSESYVTTALKYGKRRAYKAIKPLIVQTAILAKDIVQAVYLYGLPSNPRLELKKPSTLEILLVLTAVAFGVVLLTLAP